MAWLYASESLQCKSQIPWCARGIKPTPEGMAVAVHAGHGGQAGPELHAKSCAAWGSALLLLVPQIFHFRQKL